MFSISSWQYDIHSHWSLKDTSVCSDWQWTSRVSGREFPHHLLPDCFNWRRQRWALGPLACGAGALPHWAATQLFSVISYCLSAGRHHSGRGCRIISDITYKCRKNVLQFRQQAGQNFAAVQVPEWSDCNNCTLFSPHLVLKSNSFQSQVWCTYNKSHLSQAINCHLLVLASHFIYSHFLTNSHIRQVRCRRKRESGLLRLSERRGPKRCRWLSGVFISIIQLLGKRAK